MVQDISRKERLYNFIAGNGIKIIQAVFPEYFAKEPVRPTDRYIEYPFVLSNMPAPKIINDTKVLDVGSTGSMFPLLLKAVGFDVMGIDIRNYPMRHRIAFLQGDITNSYLPDNTFDIITAISTIEHIGLKGRYGKNRSNCFGDWKAVEEIYRILKPKGIFLMTVPFGKYRHISKNHRIYDKLTLEGILKKFSFYYTTVPSPEADYEIALIQATK